MARLVVSAAAVDVLLARFFADGGNEPERLRLFVPRGTVFEAGTAHLLADVVPSFCGLPVVVTEEPIRRPYLIPQLTPAEMGYAGVEDVPHVDGKGVVGSLGTARGPESLLDSGTLVPTIIRGLTGEADEECLRSRAAGRDRSCCRKPSA